MIRPLLLICLLAGPSIAAEPVSYSIDVPQVLLKGTPVPRVTITAERDGVRDATVNEPIEVQGIDRVLEGEATALDSIENGRAVFESKTAESDLVFVTDDQIVVSRDGETLASRTVRRIPGWLSLLPPVVAVVLSVLLRDVLISLFAAVYAGAVLLWSNPFVAFLRSIDTLILGEIAPSADGGGADLGHATILLFTFFLGAMVAVMSRSGGTAALLGHAERFATNRERGQVLTCLLGFLIFFDDYANALLVGGTMRPLTDRLKISRAKLAYLIDATSAPVAGLAIVSTWVGVEIGYIAAGFQQVGVDTDGYTLFLQTLPYRFYPVYLLAFTLMIAWTGRDFGSMRRAELRNRQRDQESSIGETAVVARDAVRPSLINALIPLAVLLGGLVFGMAWNGTSAIETHNAAVADESERIEPTIWAVLDKSEPVEILFLSSFAAAMSALFTSLVTRQLRLSEATEAWIAGMKAMLPASMVLVLAWAIARVCDPQHLNTAGYIVHATAGALSVHWLPALAFVIAGAVAFATGSSWSTMGLLMPLFIAVGWSLMPDGTRPDATPMLGTIGAILAGAIFGDHCSPISDTTVLSSAAAECDHIEHVTTQMPYALSVGAISLLFGYIPAGFGISSLITIPLGLAACYGVVRFCGRRLEEAA
ncbi:MAG: Na+/H+ antiporter NhaC family protein [Planctomycetaceae bacterium]|nr:Na+/H+ antiporter NhaC family protein [Planctomycetaceae bacterium]